MRRYLVLCLALATGCGASTAAAARQQFAAPVPVPSLFSQAIRVLTDFGYSVQTADKDAGLIRAERRASGGATELMTGAAYYWGLNVTLSPEGSGTRVTLQPEKIKEERGRRSTAGMMITRGQRAQVDSIAARLSAVAP